VRKKNTKKANSSTAPPKVQYIFCLYVAGLSPRSQNAIGRIRQICAEHLSGNFELEIIDIYQQPALAKAAQIIAVPTLIRKLPNPLRKFIGDISETERVLVAIGKPWKRTA